MALDMITSNLNESFKYKHPSSIIDLQNLKVGETFD